MIYRQLHCSICSRCLIEAKDRQGLKRKRKKTNNRHICRIRRRTEVRQDPHRGWYMCACVDVVLPPFLFPHEKSNWLPCMLTMPTPPMGWIELRFSKCTFLLFFCGEGVADWSVIRLVALDCGERRRWARDRSSCSFISVLVLWGIRPSVCPGILPVIEFIVHSLCPYILAAYPVQKSTCDGRAIVS